MRFFDLKKSPKCPKRRKKSKICICREIFLDFFKKPLAILLLI